LNNSTENYELYPHQFYCPKCFTKRPYSIRPISLKIRFYYLPFIDNSGENLDKVVECQACKKGFDPGILSPYNQGYIKLAGAARRHMLQGSSLETLKKELASAGLKEEIANRLIMLVQN
jgi:hypothetical protein